MNRKPLILAAVGVSAVAAALTARLLLARAPDGAAAGSDAPPPPAAAQGGQTGAAPAPAGVPDAGDFLVLPGEAGERSAGPSGGVGSADPQAAEGTGDSSAKGSEDEDADEPADAEPAVRLGGWLRGGNLPMCGRSADVELRKEPDGPVLGASLPSCEAAYGEFPAVQLHAVGPRRGDWIKVGDGWALVEEVRSAETLTADGLEFWHDLFNATVERVEGRSVILAGDTDPCAGEVCGDGHGLWEQEQLLRERYAAQYPDGVPAKAQEALEREIEEMNAASQREYEERSAAAQRRPRDERTLRLPEIPGPAKAPAVEVSGGSYVCCT